MIAMSHGDWEHRVISPPDRRLAKPVTDGIRANIKEDSGSGSSGRFGKLFTIVTFVTDGIRVQKLKQASKVNLGALSMGDCKDSYVVMD
jgi:hypothetical protein